MQHCAASEYSISIAFKSMYDLEYIANRLNELYQETGAAGRFELTRYEDKESHQQKNITFIRDIGEDVEYVTGLFKPDEFGGLHDEHSVTKAALTQIHDEIFSGLNTKAQKNHVFNSIVECIKLGMDHPNDEEYVVDKVNVNRLTESIHDYLNQDDTHTPSL